MSKKYPAPPEPEPEPGELVEMFTYNDDSCDLHCTECGHVFLVNLVWGKPVSPVGPVGRAELAAALLAHVCEEGSQP